MPIPPQNEFLLPFLNLLSDGQTYTRAQLLFRLAQHFNISEAEAQTMSGSQFTLVSRVAWCDVHFVKAGFVEKHPHHSDSLKDTFTITTLGIRELNKRPEKITVGYLRGFYLGKVHRGAGSDDTTSDAELALYDAFEKLPEPFTVLHAVKWFARTLGTVGEIDFLIAHPDLGVLIMEVKGGLIRVEQGRWFSGKHEIKDPCEQAERNRRALGDWLENDPRTKGIPVALFPAVALPDSRVAGHIRPDCPQDIFIDITHLPDLEKRLLSIFAYWKPRADARHARMGGKHAVDALVQLLVPTRSLQPRITDMFAQENRKIEELTQQQFKILSILRYQKRAAIIGGAGTGKTLLAMEKAAQLAQSGQHVLFVCYNAHLAKWISGHLQQPGIDVFTFHALVGHMVQRARMPMPHTRNWDEFNAIAPDALVDALSILHAPDANPTLLYDAIIVDEGQDFQDTWWIGLRDTLKDVQGGVFYVFFDDNQRIFTQISSIPMENAPLYLDENLRNTQHIHERLRPYARDAEVQCIGPQGRPVEIIPAADKNAERRELQRVLHRLVSEEGIPVEQIVVLTPSSEKRSQWKPDDQLGNFILTWQLDSEMSMAVRVCTIYSYKGLESPVVILTELHALRPEIADQLLYVGLSRARHHVVVIGDLPPVAHGAPQGG
ncbi:MAG: NERD domain-containing protein [Anaerolineae bacterium]|nr:NERD domain-containing protein [Anaerolineae bacterium]